jgi:16S rRNA (guanine(966)-N(2))-methyltransferase RsmD
MSLRVIAGTARGMKLKSVPGDSTRPIMDRVKESLFNIIGDDIIDAVFLDLFGGTGSVGIEALSRGAAQSVFIELDRKALKTIQDNLTHTKLKQNATVIQRNAFDVVERKPDQLYHYVYVAPPQYKDLWVQILNKLDDNTAWHDPETVVIAQIDPKEYRTPTNFKHLREYDRRKYGRTLLVFYDFASSTEEN